MITQIENEPILAKKILQRTRTNKVRRTLYDYFNLDIFDNLSFAGKDQMPIIKPINKYTEIPNRMVAFDKALIAKDTNCIIHFYEDDRRFLRIIRNPHKYLPFLKLCKAVIEPDLSQYANMPHPLRLFNAWLNRAVAAWLQQNGVNIIQNITWPLKDSYEYSITGRATNTIIAVNCTGIIGHDVSMHLWMEGYKNVVLPLNPTKIIRYGNKMPNEKTDISIYFENKNLNRLSNGRKW